MAQVPPKFWSRPKSMYGRGRPPAKERFSAYELAPKGHRGTLAHWTMFCGQNGGEAGRHLTASARTRPPRSTRAWSGANRGWASLEWPRGQGTTGHRGTAAFWQERAGGHGRPGPEAQDHPGTGVFSFPAAQAVSRSTRGSFTQHPAHSMVALNKGGRTLARADWPDHSLA